jgi:hypothetical protein
MERARKLAGIAATVLLCLFLGGATLCTLSAYQGLEELHWKLSTIDTAKVNDIAADAHQKLSAVDVQKLNAAIGKARDTLAHTDAAIVLIKQQLDQLDPRTLNTIALHIDKVVGHIDQASHDEVAQQRAVSQRSLEVLDATAVAVQQVEPVMQQLLADLIEARATLEQTTATATNVNHTTAQIDRKVTQMLKPASFAKRVLESLSTAGAQSMNWWRALQ